MMGNYEQEAGSRSSLGTSYHPYPCSGNIQLGAEIGDL